MLLYDVDSLSGVPSLSTGVLNAVISLSNLSGLIAILPDFDSWIPVINQLCEI
jgi:hypothetical protein